MTEKEGAAPEAIIGRIKRQTRWKFTAEASQRQWILFHLP